MANTLSSKKAIRQSVKRNMVNKKVKHALKSARKEVIKTASAKDAKATKENISKAYSEIDKAVKKGVIHKNTGSRYKSRIAARARIEK
jgi:small subunit ribosomal protein S20